ncbi:hypothetical protein [Cellulomonas alba]|uniref:Uncharacterized protein n=1 Tax=Cellulomonas alba TaxID=3053467 RepID=A0ABT7SD64_9CELL|nr:hypothetical protein [Cellulomonas alba]MDM7854123.1 hypothetical protein [Cellulomonas alba]
MFSLINGLPAHALLVHGVVVLVPLAALLIVVAALWPAARRRLGLATPVLAVVALLSVPPAKEAGEWLERHVPSSPLVEEHAGRGDAVLPWVLGLAVVACATWVVGVAADRRRHDAGVEEPGPIVRVQALVARAVPGWAAGTAALAVAAVVAVAVSAGAVAAVYQAGDSGARAVWQGEVSTTSHGGDGD